MNPTPVPYTIDEFRVLSLNTHKCYNVLIALLNSTDPKNFDVLCIQEPPPDLNKYPSLSSPHWDRILPTFRTSSPDTLLYVNKSIPSSSYSQNTINSSFVTSISLTLESHLIHILIPPLSRPFPLL